jgi:hypothetical protein
MRERLRRMDQIELERTQERRGGGERMNGRADVVPKSRQRQLGRARSAADLVLRLEQENGATRFGKRYRGGEPVRPCADDDGV